MVGTARSGPFSHSFLDCCSTYRLCFISAAGEVLQFHGFIGLYWAEREYLERIMSSRSKEIGRFLAI